LDQDIEDVPLLVHGPPEIVNRSPYRQKHFVHLPFVTGPGAAATELLGILVGQTPALLADGLMGHHHTQFKQQLFDIAEAEAEPKVQPHGVG